MRFTIRRAGRLRRTTAVVLAGAGLFISPLAAAEDEDLDKLTPAEVHQALEAELDDIFADKTPPNTEAELVADFEAVLHDAGDKGDPKESVISWQELVDEMAEVHTTVHAVVAQAVDQALEEPKPEPQPEPDEPGNTSGDTRAHSVTAPGAEPQSIGLDRIRAAYNNVLASLFSAIEKR